MLLAALRDQVGLETLTQCLDEFGQSHAGKPVRTEQFRSHLQQTAGADAVATLDRWLTAEMSLEFQKGNPWTIFSYEVEPDRALIVYGTRHDRAAQKEAAMHLQTEVVRRFANVQPTIKSDNEVTDEELRSHHLLLVGSPRTNQVSADILEKSSRFPVTFGQQSFSVAGQRLAHPETWVIAVGENPLNPRFSAVLFTGLNAASTWQSVRNLPESNEPDAQIILHSAGNRVRKFHLPHDH